MTGFGIRFFICNFFIALFICIMFAAKRLLKNHISARMQYNLWFLLQAIFAVPFLPPVPIGFSQILSLLGSGSPSILSGGRIDAADAGNAVSTATGWMNDFAMSVSHNRGAVIAGALSAVWFAGMLAMALYFLRSRLRLCRLERSALLLQNKNILALYHNCVNEMHLKKALPVYSTPYLSSPITTGLIHPRIYLPLHLVSEFHSGTISGKELRFMLLHELQHHRHRDALANHFINLSKFVYWFNPLVWYAMKKMQCDREIACDAAVLQMLAKEEYTEYGITLINLASRLTCAPPSYSAPMAGNKKQITRRILHIADYRPQSRSAKIKGVLLCLLPSVVLLGLSPILSINAGVQEYDSFQNTGETTEYIDLESYFQGYDGSFVLFDTETNIWQIYNQEMASRRVSPNSTYKIFDALLGLETGIITPGHTHMGWDGTKWPFDAWNTDQNLNSAMRNSVNWYFQSIDRQAGQSAVKDYFRRIGYGNQDVSGGTDSYWMESSLKISPVEQVSLLKKLYYNEFGFHSENIDAVKNAMYLASKGNASLYGKTGTGAVDGQEINGWFTGFVSQDGHVSFFAVQIQNEKNASGSKAAEIALDVLDKMGKY